MIVERINRCELWLSTRKGHEHYYVVDKWRKKHDFPHHNIDESHRMALEFIQSQAIHLKRRPYTRKYYTKIWLTEEQLLYLYRLVPDIPSNTILRDTIRDAYLRYSKTNKEGGKYDLEAERSDGNI